jgi:hypothetical protein
MASKMLTQKALRLAKKMKFDPKLVQSLRDEIDQHLAGQEEERAWRNPALKKRSKVLESFLRRSLIVIDHDSAPPKWRDRLTKGLTALLEDVKVMESKLQPGDRDGYGKFLAAVYAPGLLPLTDDFSTLDRTKWAAAASVLYGTGDPGDMQSACRKVREEHVSRSRWWEENKDMLNDKRKDKGDELILLLRCRAPGSRKSHWRAVHPPCFTEEELTWPVDDEVLAELRDQNLRISKRQADCRESSFENVQRTIRWSRRLPVAWIMPS